MTIEEKIAAALKGKDTTKDTTVTTASGEALQTKSGASL
jgi:hypothetical protein